MTRKSHQDFGTDKIAKPTEQLVDPTHQSPALAAMVHVVGGQELQVYPLLADEFVIGRVKACNVTIVDDSNVSRKHAKIFRSGVVFLIEDLGSSNGTSLNGIELTRPTELRVGDEVQVGDQVFLFKRQA